MSREDNVFGHAPYEYRKIINCIFIGGLKKDQISLKLQNDTAFPLMTCLFCYPESELKSMDFVDFQFLYPNQQYELTAPKFFSMTCTNEKGIRSYVYCFKLTEAYYSENGDKKTFLPLVIGIKSFKSDMNAFKDFFEKLYQIINEEDAKLNNYLSREILNYKKIELLNTILFCTEIIKPSPHTNIRLQFSKKNKNQSEINTINSIDFYFSSNCELPCNKNDSDINVLFAILDLEIIIKLVISILSERQILIIASDAPLLFMILPALLKLVFPFKWIHVFIPLLPRERLGFLETPVSHLIGILSRDKDDPEVKNILEHNDTKVIVDCDSNEIYNYNEYVPYVFTPEEDKTLSARLLYMERSDLFGYDLSKKTKKHFNFPANLKKIVIDCQTNKMFYDKHSNQKIDDDLSTLRQKIQLAKNPNIFNLDDFESFQRKKEIRIRDIKIDRPFSYNVQNIFLGFYRLKLRKYQEEIEDDLIDTIKDSNLFENFLSPPKYQNDSEAIIFKNILEVKEERSYKNCFRANYVLPEFPYKKLFAILNEKKISEESIETIINDYAKIRNNTMQINKKTSDKNIQLHYMKSSIKGHLKNKKSMLQRSHEVNMFNFNPLSKNDENGTFDFYGQRGFIQFINNFLQVMNKNNISLYEVCYENEIISDIISSVKSEIQIYDIEIEKAKEEDIKNDKDNIMQELNSDSKELKCIDEENYSSNEISRETFRFSKPNCSTELNLQMEDNINSAYLEFNEDKSKAAYFLFLAYNLENVKDKANKLEQYGLNGDIIEMLLKLYLKAYSLEKKDFPLYHFNLFMEEYFKLVSVEKGNPIPAKYDDLFQITQRLIIKIIAKMKPKTPQVEIRCQSEGNMFSKINNFDKQLNNDSKMTQFSNTFNNDSDSVPFQLSKDNQRNTNSEGSHGKLSNENKITSSSSSSIETKNVEYSTKIVINNTKEFVTNCKPFSIHIIEQFCQMLFAVFKSIDENILNSPIEVINQLSPRFSIDNSSVIELVAELSILDLSSLIEQKDKLAFWINCFNYLLLFTLFYKRWIIAKESDWKLFLKNVHYVIGKKEISFADMQYILFGRAIYFESDYKPSYSVKNLRVKKIDDWKLYPFLLYLPTGFSLAPKIVYSDNFKDITMIQEHFETYLKTFVKIDNERNTISLPDIFNYIDSKWLEKNHE